MATKYFSIVLVHHLKFQSRKLLQEEILHLHQQGRPLHHFVCSNRPLTNIHHNERLKNSSTLLLAEKTCQTNVYRHMNQVPPSSASPSPTANSSEPIVAAPIKPDSRSNPQTELGNVSNTPKEMNSGSRPINPAALKDVKLFYFDTLGLARKFQAQGFTDQQAFCMVEAFIDTLNTSIEHHTKSMVTKPEQEVMIQQLLAKIESVKKDMVILEKSEFTMLRNETEKQTAEIKQMKNFINDEISKLRGHFKLDINLERSRAVEAHAENEKELQQLHNKIETEVANLHTKNERYRNDFFKFVIGLVASGSALLLGYLRLIH